jgi:heat-inducible transcriptional repressor
MRPSPVQVHHAEQIRGELHEGRAALEGILARAAKVLGVLTNELGVAASPSFENAVVERLELVQVASDRLLLVLTLARGAVRTIFVEVPTMIAPQALVDVTVVLNERLAGLRLREIRRTLSDRLRDAASSAGSTELINIFIQEADELFEPVMGGGADAGGVMLSSTRPLTGQPEFSTKEGLQGLMAVTERRDLLREALLARRGDGITITIGAEHQDERLSAFTLVTSSYRSGPLSGVIGILGPTRMPYDKVVALVDHTSRLVGDLLQ